MSIQNNINGGTFGVQGYISGAILYPNVFGSALVMGDNDLYTVPTGKKAMLVGYSVFAPSLAVDYYPTLKSSSVYYRLAATVTAAAATAASVTIASPVILSAGETFAVNTATNDGLNIWLRVIEFTEGNFKAANILGPANGNNTIYTCPTGKSAIFVHPTVNTDPAILLSNDSGGTRQYNVTIAGNDMCATENTANNAVRVKSYVFTITAGDTIVVSTNSATATQAILATILEI